MRSPAEYSARREMELAARVELSSRINSLALAALAGETASEKDVRRAREVFDDLWAAEQGKRLLKWEEQRGEKAS